MTAPSAACTTVMFVVDNASGADNELRLVDWRVRDSTRRLAKIDWDDGPVTVAAYRDTAFVAVQPTPGQLQLLAVPLHGGPARVAAALPTAGLDFPLVQFSSDRNRVLLVGVEDLSDIWLLKGALPRDRR